MQAVALDDPDKRIEAFNDIRTQIAFYCWHLASAAMNQFDSDTRDEREDKCWDLHDLFSSSSSQEEELTEDTLGQGNLTDEQIVKLWEDGLTKRCDEMMKCTTQEEYQLP